ncbi:hypothetical protein [Billgrantia tianxiuensis]|uniref:hypothetical protein n=1 Tax=Billgrantia tianxiuensis TaxID=2497861 RepID=UPI001F39BD3D|nr:hypothetical protein [Halomonas tianxiuensis]
MTQPGQDPRHCYLRQLSCTAACLTLALGSIAQTKALTLEEREQLDLSAYEVVDPDASYFNVEERMEVLHETDNSLLMQHREELAKYAPSCRQRLEIPTITEKMRIPGFYPPR